MTGPLHFIRSLSFRLTIYYAVVLLIALTIVYLVSYFLVSALASGRVDSFLNTEMDTCIHLYQQKGFDALKDRAIAESNAIGKEDLLYRVYSADGAIESQTDVARFDSKHGQLSESLSLTKNPGRQLLTIIPGHNAPIRQITAQLDDGRWLSIVLSLSDDLQLINASMRLILLVMVGTGLMAVILGFVLSRNALAGILQVQRAADDLAGGKISRRAPVTRRGDEVDRLAQAFNAMAARVETLLTQLRDANDQLAHELRSPLTHIRGRSELAMTHAADRQSLQTMAGETVEACDRLLRTINTILELSETETGMTALPHESVRLDTLLAQACELFAPLAQDAGITLMLDASTAASVTGAAPKLQRLFANLLDNAIKYTPRGGSVTVAMGDENSGNVVVVVRDSGRGIDPQDLSRVFDRFYRGQRNQGVPGNGLGLPLARSIARAHGGDISVTSVVDRQTEFRVWLPRAV